MAEPNDLLSISEAARVAGISIGWLRTLCDQGRIPVERTQKGYRLFRRRDIDKYLKEREKTPPQPGRPRKKEKRSTQ